MLAFGVFAHAESGFSPFIQEQLAYFYKIDDANLTQEQMQDLVRQQEQSYTTALETIMGDKQAYFQTTDAYEENILTLQKVIRINKKAGNTYAVLRDEVKLKSYKILLNQNKLIKNVLNALDTQNMETFKTSLNSYIAQNTQENQKLLESDYGYYLKIVDDTKTLQQAKKNIKELYALVEINLDVISHLYGYEKKMYRLNKYASYHLIATVVAINKTAIATTLNPFLEDYGFSAAKILFIVILSVFVCCLRKIIYAYGVKYFLKTNILKQYSKAIIRKIDKPFTFVLLLINLEFAIYIYNDFISIENLSKAFNVLYAFFFFWLVYRILNAIANIKILELAESSTHIKHEIVNVGVKIINFTIIVIGLLFILYFSGADLTAVLSGLGIGGFAVALAAKETLSNFFGTLSILLSDIYSQGDWIVIDGQEGVVIEIGLRVTTLRTFDNALIAIPNAILASKDVKNWNKRELGRRIKMSLAIKYSSKREDIKNAVNAIRDMLENHPQIATQKTQHLYSLNVKEKLVSKDDYQGVKKNLLVYLDEFSDSSINILVYCFTKSVDWDDWLTTKEDIMYKIMEILEQNSLDFAFPSMSLYQEN